MKYITQYQQVLPLEKAVIFKNGIDLFKKRQKKIGDEAFNFLYEAIEQCRRVSVTRNMADYSYDEQKILGALQEALRDQITSASVDFLNKVSGLYQFVTANPLKTAEDIEHQLKRETKILDVLKRNATHGTTLGTILAALGAAIGAIAAGLATGGLGAGAGALLGAQWGGTAGSAFGVFTGTIVSVGSERTATLSDKQIERVANQGIAVIWGLLNHGYGKSDQVTAEQMSGWARYINDIEHIKLPTGWLATKKSEAFDYFNKAIQVLEEKC